MGKYHADGSSLNEVDHAACLALGDDLAIEEVVRACRAGGDVLLDQPTEVDRRHAGPPNRQIP